ncbi:class I SAM-dependent methyltransferase [Streptomyces sp. SID13666]|uniref:class I SAM-dependent methyltransferase n=1 Tax=unclassified Streptomyces TaxID=2593676 RepID=UPI0013BEED98|nr:MULTISPECIES: class I SAM-dependent methyltransferase [unclassified Streptomyces]NEA56632.1 class I SAM-dependent methyltransferase [Streptomyces sp. SID13666]NEA73076.1 class I SAM-dependent methyltransferase [Streptomyces sp. SID13588]
MASFEFPGKYYEIIRQDFRNLEAESSFFASYLPAGGRVLDLGCGTGTNLRALRNLGYTCTGVDQSENFIEFAKESGGNIQYIHCRAADYETEGKFDLIYAVFVTLNYLKRDELGRLLTKAREWLRPGGRFVVDIGHMLNFVDNYQPYIVAHHRSDGILITRLIRHAVNAHTANWRHEETILVREKNGQVSMYDNFFDQLALTAPELRQLLKDAGLSVTEEYGSFQKVNPSPLGKGHLIFVATANEDPSS